MGKLIPFCYTTTTFDKFLWVINIKGRKYYKNLLNCKNGNFKIYEY